MKKRFVFTLIISSILFNITSCNEKQKTVKPITIKFKKEGKLSIFEPASDTYNNYTIRYINCRKRLRNTNRFNASSIYAN